MTARRWVAGLTLVTALGLTACDGAEPPRSNGSPSSPTGQASPTGTTTATPDAQPAPAALVAPRAARDADDLARRLVAAEDAVRDGSRTEAEVAQAAFDAQVLYRQLGRTPAWRREVLAAVGGYRDTVADHLDGRSSLRSVLTTLTTTLPAWRIVRPAAAEDLMRFYRKGERRYGVPWHILAAVNFVETGFGKIRGLSSAGARGPMQFISSTWEAYGQGDIDDPNDSIMAAARYLAASGGDTPAGLDRALHAYNNHGGYVRGIRAYARIMERDPEAFGQLYRWQIIYLSRRGDVWLPIGYHSRRSIAVDRYLRQHPDRLLSRSTD